MEDRRWRIDPSSIFHPLSSILVPLDLNIEAFIRSARVAHLATADKHRQPHVVPICFVFDGKNFYSPIDDKPKRVAPRQLKRLRNIRENPRVALVIDRYAEDWRRLAYVLIRGSAKILTKGKLHAQAVRRLRRKYPQYRRMAIDQRPLIVITTLRITAWGNF
ncbi:MAG: TIGR03668 family PPOX class F420-dependent oxidoreductase [Deltaproteobacteria bacterium]|nr:TIGR03668 family PPOX class F420-dependent oxidoreductase [Deltaproteobacteria bacterium]MBI2181999.1 TIGR03668 family PPOX class F420-dependent oxidoreductase [Deltaproteobacteria bacterium]MBI2230084.1 TIGR03668 family PPOX class F420-dependent oxidoreductase [Deltaproteobacteria bacterium]